MQLIRSWPMRPPVGRSYVVDDAPRMLNDQYSYRGLLDYDDDLIQLDWDTAVSREDLQRFAKRARQAPGRVLVAPVPVYPDSRRGMPETVWNCRRYEGDVMRYVRTDEPSCHLFGFGMVYLPRELVRAFSETFADELESGAVRFDDSGFAGWHHRNVEPEAPIAWDVRPVHLHYRISEVAL